MAKLGQTGRVITRLKGLVTGESITVLEFNVESSIQIVENSTTCPKEYRSIEYTGLYGQK